MRFLFLAILCSFVLDGFSQAHETSAEYHPPTDPLVLKNLDEWQDLKFGLFMHWGPYSQWGVVESWSLCPEDEDWTQRNPQYGKTYEEYKKNYENLQTTFNPTDFNPQKWADAAKAAGMRYVVFTTKHHDGFAMFDTKESDYKITSSKTPFSSHPQADVTKTIFETFRKENFKIGAYFSKPDWHNENYWWPYFPPKDRHVNYDPTRYPERWNRFKDFVHAQINELTSNYGKVDILWLDGGWVRHTKPMDYYPDGTLKRPNQDIDMDKVGAIALKNQPGIIVVDRAVVGKWENYITPEQKLPEDTLNVPWESCITMGDSFSYVPNDNYKSSKKIIETLVKIISRGGNYLLNIAPGPNGDYDQIAYDRLNQIAAWMKINQSAVYATRVVAPFQSGEYFYTKSKDDKVVNVFHIQENHNEYQVPNTFKFPLPALGDPRSVTLLGVNAKLKWKLVKDEIEITVPKNTKLEKAAVLQLRY